MGNPHNTYAFRGGQRFVTFHCKHIGICTVLLYEGGGGVKNLEKLRTYYVDVPYYLVPNFDFFINWRPESPRVGLSKTSKQSIPEITPSISGKTRGDWEKWLWYLDSASLNYPGTDTLVLAIDLAEICVIISRLWKNQCRKSCFQTYFRKIAIKVKRIDLSRK